MNTLVSMLKSNLDSEIYKILESHVEKLFLNPIGGWREWGYDSEYSWNAFQETRQTIQQFPRMVRAEKYVELGFSTIPFLKNCQWAKIGIIEHPNSWIKKAHGKFHRTPGDGLSWIPETESDYAKLWSDLVSKLENNCDHIYCVENILLNPSDLLKHFNATSNPLNNVLEEIPNIEDDVWKILEEQALRVGYEKNGLCSEFVWENKVEVLATVEHSNVSVIIAARNNGKYLDDTIRSVINQSVKPVEIIYIDDGSIDNSVEIARKHPEVKVIQQPHLGVCAARNKGVEESIGEYLLHLDGDDIFPYNYIQYKLEALKSCEDASFVYSAAQAFGGDYNYYWNVPEWEDNVLWDGNFINTSTLVKKEHFIKCGMWHETIGTAWDWDVWIRMVKAGYFGVRDPKGFLLYRQHAESVSAKNETKCNYSQAFRMKYLIRNAHCRTQISTILSDRIVDFFPIWIKNIVDNVKFFVDELMKEPIFDSPGEIQYLKPNLTIIYTGKPEHKNFIFQQLNQYSNVFNNINFLCQQWTNNYSTEIERRDNVAEFMAKSCNKLMQTEDEIIWFVEDDILPPIHAMYELNKSLLLNNSPRSAVAGIYRNRHDPRYLVAHNWLHSKAEDFEDDFEDDELVDITGTGCLMIFKPFANHKFGSHINGIPAHDWNWCLNIKDDASYPTQKKVLLKSNVVCKHFQTMTKFV